jgi:hypothetical protein
VQLLFIAFKLHSEINMQQLAIKSIPVPDKTAKPVPVTRPGPETSVAGKCVEHY